VAPRKRGDFCSHAIGSAALYFYNARFVSVEDLANAAKSVAASAP
jgi:hypothetical protein